MDNTALDLSISFCGITFKNPIIAASGTFGYGVEFEDIVSLEKLGGFVIKGLSREPMAGNPPPRAPDAARPARRRKPRQQDGLPSRGATCAGARLLH